MLGRKVERLVAAATISAASAIAAAEVAAAARSTKVSTAVARIAVMSMRRFTGSVGMRMMSVMIATVINLRGAKHGHVAGRITRPEPMPARTSAN
jgi:hypothetical protein